MFRVVLITFDRFLFNINSSINFRPTAPYVAKKIINVKNKE